MVYFDQHIVLPLETQRRIDIFAGQFKVFLSQMDRIITHAETTRFTAASKEITGTIREAEKLMTNANRVVEVAVRFTEGLELLIKIMGWVLVALIVLIGLGILVARGQWNRGGRQRVEKNGAEVKDE
ncbi:hypothetical protein K504DRAFT_496067 [Pleomassaria siparia CBS 279.74]|uniref:Uncharacterized protein n=1 Tax=Pleomassaria siparia CBS 279.74 TaxID=1314801 RepID=A0A6G1JQ30_9PLEO|nr:hypothetical protein K504DRAFT_496067 [Pleomassaria siparia CBS 279.74]